MAPGFAHADGLTGVETERLLRGETVIRSESMQRAGRRYVGGIAYALVDASADDLARLMTRAETWHRVVPRTRSARRVGEAGDDAWMELTHGGSLVHATYTLRVRRDARGVRFWLDPGRPHDIEDAWGFVRTEPHENGRTLMVYGVLIDLGPGWIRDLFEDRVRAAALSVPDAVRGLVLEQSAFARSLAP